MNQNFLIVGVIALILFLIFGRSLIFPKKEITIPDSDNTEEYANLCDEYGSRSNMCYST